MQNTINQNDLSKEEVVFEANIISGKYAAPFWDGIYKRANSIEPIKALQSALEALHDSGKNIEAIQLMFALFVLTEMDYPVEIDYFVQDDELAGVFIGEYLADTEDLMAGYLA